MIASRDDEYDYYLKTLKGVNDRMSVSSFDLVSSVMLLF